METSKNRKSRLQEYNNDLEKETIYFFPKNFLQRGSNRESFEETDVLTKNTQKTLGESVKSQNAVREAKRRVNPQKARVREVRGEFLVNFQEIR